MILAQLSDVNLKRMRNLFYFKGSVENTATQFFPTVNFVPSLWQYSNSCADTIKSYDFKLVQFYLYQF